MSKTVEITLLRCLAKDGCVKAVLPLYRRVPALAEGSLPLTAIEEATKQAADAPANTLGLELDRVLGFLGRLSPMASPKNFEDAARQYPTLALRTLSRYYAVEVPEADDTEALLAAVGLRYGLEADPDGDGEEMLRVTALLKDHVRGDYRTLSLYVDPETPAASLLKYLDDHADGRLQPVTLFSGDIEQPLPEAEPPDPATAAPPRRSPISDPLGRTLSVLLDVALEQQGLLAPDPDELPGRGLDWLAEALARRSIVALVTDIPFGEQGLARALAPKLNLPQMTASPLNPTDLTLDLSIPPGAAFVVLPMVVYPQLADPERIAHGLASGEHAVLISCAALSKLPEVLRNIIEETITLPRLDKPILERILFALYGERLKDLQEADVQAWISYVQPWDLARIARRQPVPEVAVSILQNRIDERLGRLTPSHGPSLSDLSGLGEAKVRAEMLINDIRAALAGSLPWDAVDRGMLLVGPPGCGKTTLARAIAKDCGIHFLECSAARWQMAGYLNDHLSAMARDFQEARRFEPSIIFIDEIDSIGSRDNFTGGNAAYSTQVVNALLAELQGFSERGKVFVIAATNDVDNVDPALRRAGRLDRVIKVGLPTIDALEKIFAFYLHQHGIELSGESGIALRPLAEGAFGRSGADVSLIVRGAIRRARLAGRPLGQDDLLAELYERPLDNGAARPLTGEGLRRTALHEAGHALLRLETGDAFGAVAYISIIPRTDGSLGFVSLRPNPDIATLGRADYMALLMVTLGGRAAEEVFYGPDGIGAGAGGGETSDLAKGTTIALDMICRLGLGRDMSLGWHETPTDADRQEADQLLAEAYALAKETLAAKRSLVERIAVALVKRQEMSGEELHRLVTRITSAE